MNFYFKIHFKFTFCARLSVLRKLGKKKIRKNTQKFMRKSSAKKCAKIKQILRKKIWTFGMETLGGINLSISTRTGKNLVVLS